MEKQKGGALVGLIIIIIIIAGAFVLVLNKGSNNEVAQNVPDNMDSQMEDDKMMDDQIMDKDSEMADEMGTKLAGSPGIYSDYSPEKVAEYGGAVLFFHASWCPTCKALDSDLSTRMGDIPGDVNILKVDYDKETELKSKYGITYQHQLVQVDAAGNMIQKWSGSLTLDQVLQKL